MNFFNQIASANSAGHPEVLVMEDESLLAQGLQMVLREEGYGVDLAATGEDALDTMRRKGYDLLVADLQLPDMDGIEVIKRLKNENPDTGVIVITGYPSVSSALEAFKTGVFDYLAKPLTEDDFVAAVNKAIQEKKPHSGDQKLLRQKDVMRVLRTTGDPPAVSGADNAIESLGEDAANAGLSRSPAFSGTNGISPDQAAPQESGTTAQAFTDMPQLLHQDKMISMGRLAASVVHEINNPLSGILNYIRLMIKIMRRSASLTPEEAEKFQRYLILVEEEVDRCSSIVSNLLAFSRKSEMQYSGVNISELLEKCIMLSAHKLELEHITRNTRVDKDIPMAWGDFNQIQQCVINLIFNAIDAMDKGGTLTLAARYDNGADMVEIAIGDDGRGIPEEERRNIFEPFFTTKTDGRGLGLGLSTVHQIIEQHNGEIDVDSEPGKGTTFTIRLPAAQTV